MSLDQQLRAQTLKQTPIFEVLDELGIPHRPGDQTQQIPCPFHTDRSPSCRVYAESNSMYCFTCGAGWDVIGIVKAYLHLDYSEALSWIEQHFGTGIDAEVSAQVRTTLRQSRVVSVEPLIELASHQILQAKRRLGLDRYTKAWLALDTVVDGFRRHQLDAETLSEKIDQILQFVQRIDPVPTGSEQAAS